MSGQVMPRMEFDILWNVHGPNYACWEYFDRWCRQWHEAHPDEDADLLELINIFADRTSHDR